MKKIIQHTDDEGEEVQAPIAVGNVTRVGGVVEVAGVKWKRVENIARYLREGIES